MDHEPFKYRKRRSEAPVEPEKPRASHKITGSEFKASSLGWEIAIPIAGGPVIGMLIDRKLGLEGTFSLILLTVGVMIAVVQTLRYIRDESLLAAIEKKKIEEERAAREAADGTARRCDPFKAYEAMLAVNRPNDDLWDSDDNETDAEWDE